jgi:ribosomal protein S2
MGKLEVKELLDAGVHFGHLTRKWNPNMAPFIYMERNGIHIINLYKTVAKIDEASEALKKIAASGRKILFVATKKQAKEIVAEAASKVNMPYITERCPGGMLTNFVTIRKAVKKMAAIDRMKKDGTFNTLSKKERLQTDRLRDKLEKNLGSISDMTRLPGALFVVDIIREHIAIKEAQKLLTNKDLSPLKTVGYKELFPCFEGKESFQNGFLEIKKNTRRYAKRQITWFKKYDNALIFSANTEAKVIYELLIT